MMRAVRLLTLIIAAGLLVPAAASAQTPPPDERAAAQALADAAKRLIATADGLEDDAVWLDTCEALDKEPPARRRERGVGLRGRARARGSSSTGCGPRSCGSAPRSRPCRPPTPS